MAWCPKCKNEYVEGITICADCGSELVETLPPETDGADVAGVMEEPDENVCLSGTEDAEEEGTKAMPLRGAYKDNAQKAADCKDSGYTLVGVGALGLLAVGLSAAGVLPVRLGGSAAVLSYGVMGAMFLIFFIIGVRSMQSAGKYRKEAVTESNLKEQILHWCRDNLTAEKIEEPLVPEGLSEEEKYFRRTERIRALISHSFINIEEGFLDNLIDEFYPELFKE